MADNKNAVLTIVQSVYAKDLTIVRQIPVVNGVHHIWKSSWWARWMGDWVRFSTVVLVFRVQHSCDNSSIH